MWIALMLIGFLGAIGAVVMVVISLFKRRISVMWKWLVGVGVAFVLFVVGGVLSPSQPSKPAAEPQQSASASQPANGTVAQSPTTSQSSGTAAASQPVAANQDADRTAALQKYLTENFGGAGDPKFATSWWKLITQVTVSGSDATVLTDIYPDAEGKQVATNIRAAVLGYINDQSKPDTGIKWVTIRGQGNSILATGQSLR